MLPILSNLLSRFLIDRKNGHRLAVVRKYRENLRVSAMSSDDQCAYQDRCLAELLNHAREHVPFWWEHIREEVTAVNAREMLKTLPVMTRAMIQEDRRRFEAQTVEGSRLKVEGEERPETRDLRPENFSNLQPATQSQIANQKSQIDHQSKIQNPKSKIVEDATGGSSGTPMRFLVDRETQIAREASLYWADHLAGWRYGDRIAMLWGSDKDNKSATREAKLAFRWWIDNRRWFNAFNMGEDRMAGFHAAMTRFKPHVIVAYAGSLEIYSRFLKHHLVDKARDKAHDKDAGSKAGSTNDDAPATLAPCHLAYPLTALVSSAEVLTPQARSLIESVFGKPVYDRYGNREFGAIAAEDGQGGLLVNPADMILETNEKGELLVTYLPNHAMPFIRYNTGDLVRFREDGRMEPVVGRSADTIRTATGKLIHGEYFTHLMYRAKGVREFQFVQESLSHYQLLLVADQPESEHVMAGIRADIMEEIGADAAFEVKYVKEIPVLKSGKRKFTLSRLHG